MIDVSDSILSARLPIDAIRRLCAEYPIRELAVFGSILGDAFHSHSDLDLLIDFEPGAKVGFLKLTEIRERITALVNRPVDLVLPQGLKPVIRQEVLASALVIYAK